MIVKRRLYSEKEEKKKLTREEKDKLLKKGRNTGLLLTGIGGGMKLIDGVWRLSGNNKKTDLDSVQQHKAAGNILLATGSGLAIGSEVARRINKKRAKEEEKKFNEPEELSPRELQLENMKMQRQIMINNRQRQKLEEQARRDKLKRISQAQRLEEEKDEQAAKNQIKVKKLEQDSDDKNSATLYKVASRLTPPVPMKI